MTLPDPQVIAGWLVALWAAYEARKTKIATVAVETKTQVHEEGLEKRLKGGVETFSRLAETDQQQATQIATNTEGIAELRASIARLEGQVEVLTKMLLSREGQP